MIEKNEIDEQRQPNAYLDRMHQSTSRFVHLGQWLQNIFEPEWQSLEVLLAQDREDSFALSFRNSSFPKEIVVKRGTLVDLGLQLGSESVVLVVAIAPDDSQGMNIFVQLRPSSGETYLPPNIKLIMLLEFGVVLQEIQARQQDNFIQIKQFWGQLGESFSIQVMLAHVYITENFTI
jgi:Protein of unknown function (DUF1822)